jgi:hypothetical protein
MGAMLRLWALAAVAVALLAVAACGPAPQAVAPATTVGAKAEMSAAYAVERDPEVPALPFPDNIDPAECGIPEPWNGQERARLTGMYEGRLVEPTVHMYNSHSRNRVVGRAPSGAAVRIKMYQANPTLNFYLVRTVDHDPPQEGWVPAPFVQLDAAPAK